MKSQEKPELSPILQELIAEDIKKNIEARRLAEAEEAEAYFTSDKPQVLTTEKPAEASQINNGLIDDFSILEEAGSENKQSSRIQIKKGPNGQEYEYEYVYYYYDDDEEKNPEDDDVIIANKKTPINTSNSGKNRYTNIDRTPSSTPPAINDIPPSRGKARAQSIPVYEEPEEERLPQVTRFPSRGKAENAAPESGKKNHVKRPSLELVDSHSFVTDEKDKVSNKGRIIETDYETEQLSKSEETASKKTVEYEFRSTTAPAVSSNNEETETTPLMEKLAVDLYAILANENASEEDKKGKKDSESTEAPETEEELVTEKIVPETTEQTTTSTTTPEPTTQSTTTSTTTTPEPTTEAPAILGGRRPIGSKNRFNISNRNRQISTTTTEAPQEVTKAAGRRFQRPNSFGSRNAATRATQAPSSSGEAKETVEKVEASPVSSSNRLGARNKNRFSLNRSASTTERAQQAEEAPVTKASISRPRPSFNIRGRGRPGVVSSTTPEAPTEEKQENTLEVTEDKPVEKPLSSVRPTSRLNIGRPTSRLLPGQKPRISPLVRSKTAEEEAQEKHNEGDSNDPETTTQSNINKLKNRPRIQISTDSKKKATPSNVVINRKANPLISKRKFGAPSTGK